MSRTARAITARWGLKEAVRKLPARGTKRIQGIYLWARGPKDSKPNSHPEGIAVDATGMWEESRCAIPGEICPPGLGASVVVRRHDGRAEVSRGHTGFGAEEVKART